MKQNLLKCLALAAASLLTLSAGHASTIVNIDFNGVRGSETSAGTDSSVPSVGGTGTTWNGLTADSRTANPLVNNDNLNVGGSGLVDQFGTATTVGFSIVDVGGDNNSLNTTPPHDLFDDYIFNNSAGNSVGAGGSAFTISGLTGATTANLYFYYNSAGNIVNIHISGSSGTDVGYEEFLNVPVTGGIITGAFGYGGTTSVLPAMSISFTPSVVPEPSTWAMMFGGIGMLIAFQRLRRTRTNS